MDLAEGESGKLWGRDRDIINLLSHLALLPLLLLHVFFFLDTGASRKIRRKRSSRMNGLRGHYWRLWI